VTVSIQPRADARSPPGHEHDKPMISLPPEDSSFCVESGLEQVRSWGPWLLARRFWLCRGRFR
jgi:hypothetical protein